MIIETLTTEEIALHYSACLDSLTILLDSEAEQESLDRNIEHLQLMLSKDFWTDQDFSAINEALASHL
tara:strand:- start:363 stop:566 length:204 start_codon:yes stop_codon:yes gene_type:complete